MPPATWSRPEGRPAAGRGGAFPLTAGVASMCQLRAVENGADRIDTAISSMAWGTSHPGTESMVAALRGTPHDTGLDLELIREIGMYFHAVRKKYHQFESEFTGVDTRAGQPGAGRDDFNLANQLKEQGALNRMGEVLEEIRGSAPTSVSTAGDADFTDRRHPGVLQRARRRALQRPSPTK